MPFSSSSEFEIAHWNHDIRLIPNQISPFLLSFFVLVPFGWGEEQLLPEWTESLLHPFPGSVVNRRRVGGRWEEKDFRTFLNLKQDQFLIAETVYICQNAVTRVFQSTYHCQVQQKVFCGRSLEVGPTLVQTWESQVIPVHWEIVKKHSEFKCVVLTFICRNQAWDDQGRWLPLHLEDRDIWEATFENGDTVSNSVRTL